MSAVALAGCTVATPVLAGQVTDTLQVSAVVPNVCSLSVSPLTFGTIPIDAGKTVDRNRPTSDIKVTCLSGTPYTIYMGDGLNSTDPFNRILVGADPTQKLVYYLLVPLELGNHVWQDTAGPGAVPDVGNGTAQSHIVTGVIRPGQALPKPGTYTDSVVVTVAY